MRQDAPSISVVIPTHKRARILSTCLEHLAAQTIVDEIEAIVVSDGHDPDTAALFRTARTDALRVRFLEIPKSHQGVARNRGVELAGAPVTLFIGDDILLAPDACEEHQLAHDALEFSGESASAVLGYTCWDPTLEQTPLLRWLDETGWQFGYPMLADCREDFVPRGRQHRFTYTSHLSVPTAIARRLPFREDVTLYGWEDMEWGMRLRSAGVRLFYAPAATAVHHHPMTLAQSLARMRTLGRSAVVMRDLVPGFDRMPRGLKLLAYRALGMLPTLRGRHAKAFADGIREGLSAGNG